MRHLITGVDADGRSCVVQEHTVEPKSADRSRRLVSFETTSNPAPPRPPGQGEYIDLGIPVGHVQIMVGQWSTGYEYGMHHTDTIDIDTVIEGSVVFILDDGEHVLEAGDVVVVNGVDHAWRSGPDGATMQFVFLGTPTPEGAGPARFYRGG
jgi:quercetin dioxygenase-like cupin family protein